MARAPAGGVVAAAVASGVLSVFGQLKQRGDLPADMQAKVSVTLPVANPASPKVIASMGAGTLNLPTDLTLGQMVAIREAVTVPLDVYVEAPDNLGGFVRHYELPPLPVV